MAKEKMEALVPVEEQPYPVPENWQWYRVESINRYKSESINPFEYSDELFELYSVPSSDEEYPEIIEGKDIGSSKMLVQKGDVLLCKINPRINRVWQVYCYTENRYIASSEWIIIRSELLNPAYLMYCFRSSYFRKYMLSNVSGVGGSLMRAQPKFVKEYPVPIPPIPEQKRIVDHIESLFAKLDEAKEKAQAIVDGFEDRKAAILHQAFTGKLTEKWRLTHHILFSSWETETIASRFEIVGGIQKTPARVPKKNPIPYITVANVYRNAIDLSEIRYFEVNDEEIAKLRLKEKDILIVEGNGSGNEIGRCAMWHNELPLCIHQNHIIRARVLDEQTVPEYVLYFLNSDDGMRIIREKAVTTAGLYNLSVGKIKSIIAPFPKKEEQEEIVHILDSLINGEYAVKEAAENTLVAIDNMKKAILAQAFRGELGTNDPSEPPADIS